MGNVFDLLREATQLFPPCFPFLLNQKDDGDKILELAGRTLSLPFSLSLSPH